LRVLKRDISKWSKSKSIQCPSNACKLLFIKKSELTIEPPHEIRVDVFGTKAIALEFEKSISENINYLCFQNQKI
jgi:hypothetical protein